MISTTFGFKLVHLYFIGTNKFTFFYIFIILCLDIIEVENWLSISVENRELSFNDDLYLLDNLFFKLIVDFDYLDVIGEVFS